MATRRVAETFHFKKANLVETAGEDVDYVAVVGSSLRKVIIELWRCQ